MPAMKPSSPLPRYAHRSLHLSTPLADGPDVRALQESLQAALADHKIDWLPLSVDGRLGTQTLHAARFFSWVIGLGKRHRKLLKKGTISESTQRLLRNPEQRSNAERLRAKRRQGKLEKIRKRQSEGPAAAVAYARSFVGTTESPYGSNSGPSHTNSKGQRGGVTFWEAYWGLGPCYWCLCFASYCAKAIGGAKISGNCCYSVEIERMARAHEGGWVAVPQREARPGDIALFCFDGSGVSDHGELVAEHGVREDIGGNTSSDDSGSQSNGGGVFSKRRDLSQLTCVARPLY